MYHHYRHIQSVIFSFRMASSASFPLEASIRNRLSAAFTPVFMDVINESYKHNVPPGSETHFKVVVVSSQFVGKRPIECHRMVNHVLSEELQGGVHALSIQAVTPEKWEIKPEITQTPHCLGGSKH